MGEANKTAPGALALDARDGWPADLRLLIDRYPRAVWQAHDNLGAMAQFYCCVSCGVILMTRKT